MIHHKIDQNTDEWMELRKGKFTASTFSDLFMTKSTKGYRNAIRKVVYETMTGEQPESFSNDYMKRGTELEPVAREEYEKQTFNTVEDAGFFELNEWVGASPDGLVGEDGIVEIKCPAYSTMIDYLMKPELPKQYFWQVQGQLWVTGRKYCDFMCYHPKLKPIFVRVERDEEAIKDLEAQVELCINEVKSIIEKIS